MALVNVKEASDHLHLGIDFGEDFDPADFDVDDFVDVIEMPELLSKIAMAEAIIRNYLKVDSGSPEWEPDNARDKDVVRSAVLLMLGSLWENREDQSDMLSPNGAVARLLMRLRDPAIA